jgi:LPS export ABC transporter protein LptC
VAAGGAARTGPPVKRALVLVLLMLAAGLYAWFAAQRGGTPLNASGATPNDDSNSYTAEQVELVETGEDGMARYRLQAEHVEQQDLASPLLLREPRISFQGTTGGDTRGGDIDWQLAATRGTLSVKRDEVQFTGEVQAHASRGDERVLRLTTTQLTVNTVQQVVTSSREVALDWAGVHLVAGGIRIELGSGMVKIGPGHGFQAP